MGDSWEIMSLLDYGMRREIDGYTRLWPLYSALLSRECDWGGHGCRRGLVDCGLCGCVLAGLDCRYMYVSHLKGGLSRTGVHVLGAGCCVLSGATGENAASRVLDDDGGV